MRLLVKTIALGVGALVVIAAYLGVPLVLLAHDFAGHDLPVLVGVSVGVPVGFLALTVGILHGTRGRWIGRRARLAHR